ncbi:hypothetical protein BU16DRAFT_534216 [Lophium mytilinum]|uniref:F-box domain-containing protein n=1 Tax=Lophium mytilinum TaxID=390894 RepID=A0A6A6RA54_9PEZI|nr:hypothetical protein BU16DRAFT_534216 [Lophium mytilinum]
MGSWDFYCACCGGGFKLWSALPPAEEWARIRKLLEEGSKQEVPRKKDENEEDGEEEEEDEAEDDDEGWLDCSICSHESTDWMKHLRLLGHNPHGKVGRGVFLTGLGYAQDYGSTEVEPGNHPNVLTADGPDVQTYYSAWDGKLQLSVYVNVLSTGDELIDFPLPFHDQCLQMIRRVISGKPDGEISIDTLYDAMGTARGGLGTERDPRPYNNSSLFLNYYQFAGAAREQYWGADRGYEPWYNDPIDIPAISKFLKNLPRAAPPREVKASDPAKDPFAKMPLELLVEIIMQLPQESLLPFFLSSRAARLASQSQWVWKKRILVDMPWMWELDEKKDYPEEVDWHAVYAKLDRLSFPEEWEGLKVSSGYALVFFDTGIILYGD